MTERLALQNSRNPFVNIRVYYILIKGDLFDGSGINRKLEVLSFKSLNVQDCESPFPDKLRFRSISVIFFFSVGL